MITVYRYALGQPRNWGEDCEQEMRRQNTLWNTLVEIDRSDRVAYEAQLNADAAVASLTAQVADCSDRITRGRERRKQQRAQARRRLETPELDQAIECLYEQRRSLYGPLQQAKVDARQRFASECRQLAADHKALVKRARQCSGCYWGNYNAVVESYKTARSQALKTGGILRFHRWQGVGRLTVQPQKGVDGENGVSTEEILAGRSPLVRILDGGAIFAVVCHTHGGKRWASWPLRYHRELPAGARVKRVTVNRRRRAKHWIWSVSLTLCLPNRDIEHVSRRAAGLNLNWRLTAEGVRIAALVGSDGAEKIFCLPESIVARFRELPILQSRLDELCLSVQNHVNTLPEDGPLEHVLAPLRRDRQLSPRQIQDLVYAWRDGGQDFFPRVRRTVLSHWSGSAHHRDAISTLWEWVANSRAKASAARNDYYRKLAKILCDEYALLILDDSNLAEMALTEDKQGRPSVLHDAARAQRQMVGLYRLREYLEQQAAKTGARIERQSIRSTRTCHGCSGSIPAPPEAVQLICHHCGQSFDRDINAASNLLAAVNSVAA